MPRVRRYEQFFRRIKELKKKFHSVIIRDSFLRYEEEIPDEYNTLMLARTWKQTPSSILAEDYIYYELGIFLENELTQKEQDEIDAIKRQQDK